MNKKQKAALIIILVFTFILGFNDSYPIYIPLYKDSLAGRYPKIVSQSWERTTAEDTETIYFTEDGKFGYYCSCGSPVDYYDLCDSYKYDQETNTIKLKCLPGVKVDKLKILEVTDTKLVLDFNGEKREFITEYSHLIDNPLPFAGIKFRTPGSKEEIELEFTKEGNFEAFNKTKNKYALGSDVCFNWTYSKKENEITLDCQDHTRTIKINKYVNVTGNDVYPVELELYFKHEDKTLYFTKVKDNN